MTANSLTYNDLLELIPRYLERRDENFLLTVPYFIRFAQENIARKLKTLETTTELTGNFVVGQPIIQKPTNWRQMLAWEVQTGTGGITTVPLQQRTQEFIQAFAPTLSTSTGVPKYYADVDQSGRNWVVAPVPDQAYQYRIRLQITLPYLSESNQQNILTQYAPDLLLYACLLETPLYVKDDNRLQLWQARYNEVLDALKNEDIGRKTTGFSDLSKI